MPKLKVHAFGISVDGFGAGPSQSLENPLGIGGMALHDWAFPTRTFQRLSGKDDGTTGIDDDFVARGFENIGAWIIGRNMFGPVRGPWPDETWKGWWGENPPFHTPVFVLTHHARAPVPMAGQTTFHFVTEGIQAAPQRAIAGAKGKDVRIGGGVAKLREKFSDAQLVELTATLAWDIPQGLPLAVAPSPSVPAGLGGCLIAIAPSGRSPKAI